MQGEKKEKEKGGCRMQDRTLYNGLRDGRERDRQGGELERKHAGPPH